ncbi:MAG: hypothetical protein ABUT20_02435 [Bacteroidota bacterium]
MPEEKYNVYFDEQKNMVVMKWYGYCTSGEFRDGTELMLETLIKNKASKVLADIREMDLIGQEDQHWLENNFLPRAITAGFKKIAIVQPQSYFNKVAVECISRKINKEQLTLEFRENIEEAVGWLMNG